MRNLRCSVVMDDPLRFARAPLRRRALSPAGVGALPCTGKRSSLYRGLTSPAGEKRIPRARVRTGFYDNNSKKGK